MMIEWFSKNYLFILNNRKFVFMVKQPYSKTNY
jgi:hypothetical protein